MFPYFVVSMIVISFALTGIAGAADGLLPCRLALQPLLARLEAAGGDPARAVRVLAAADLLRLESGARYKFSQPSDGRLRVAPAPADRPRNEYSHPVLVRGAAVRTAGGVEVVHDGRAITRVTLDQDSKSYCPSLASLTFAVEELVRLGIGRGRIVTRDRPPKCEPPLLRATPPSAGSGSAVRTGLDRVR